MGPQRKKIGIFSTVQNLPRRTFMEWMAWEGERGGEAELADEFMNIPKFFLKNSSSTFRGRLHQHAKLWGVT